MTREEIRQEALKAEKESFPRCAGDPENSFHGVTSAYGLGFVDGALWVCNKSPWISVKEELPPEEESGISVRVLVLNTNKNTGFGRYDYDNKIWLGPGLDTEFTHWMLIPEPPKTGD